MGRPSRSEAKPQTKSRRPPVKELNSDEEYERSEKPDYTQDSYYFDDEDDFHSNKTKILLKDGANIHEDSDVSEEEVLGLGSSSEDEEIAGYEKRLRQLNVNRFKYEAGSDDDDDRKDDQDDEGVGRISWGSKRNEYYGADFVDDRKIDFNEEIIDPHVLEEQEAIALQKRMAAQLDEADFQLDSFFMTGSGADEGADDSQEVLTVAKDLTTLDDNEKLQLLKTESPELLVMIADFKAKMKELHSRWMPLYRLVKDGTLPDSSGARYIQAKVQLLMNYCVNLGFYLTLKARRTPVHNHPVIKRLVQYRNLINEMQTLDDAAQKEVNELLQKMRTKEPLSVAAAEPTPLKRKRVNERTADKVEAKPKRVKLPVAKKAKVTSKPTTVEPQTAPVAGGRTWGRKRAPAPAADSNYNTSGEQQALEYYAMMKTGRRAQPTAQPPSDVTDTKTARLPSAEQAGAGGEVAGGEEGARYGDEDDKRGITYEMAKNKGLMPKRKKEQRNPRVKHRLKYRKAKIRRRGQVREAKTEMTRYAGELSGIRAGVKKSTRL